MTAWIFSVARRYPPKTVSSSVMCFDRFAQFFDRFIP
jgi:hypothetical protein